MIVLLVISRCLHYLTLGPKSNWSLMPINFHIFCRIIKVSLCDTALELESATNLNPD